MTMGTKTNNLCLVLSLCFTTVLYSQKNEDKIPIPSTKIYIGGVTNNMNINQCIIVLGEPLRNEKNIYEFGPDGLEEVYTLAYDSLIINYIKYYGKVLMSNISVTGRKYKIIIADQSLSIGDSLSVLETLLNSSFNCRERILNKNDEIIKLIFEINTVRENSNSFGSISIEIENGEIKRLGIIFDEDLT
jgi:hypothetical protein